MTTVKSVDDIRRNPQTFDSYLLSESDEVRPWATDRLRLGHNLVACAMKGRATLVPSRFIGCTKYCLARHRKELPENLADVAAPNQPNGGQADPAIDGVADRVRPGQPVWKRLERFHRELCSDRGSDAANIRRTYWDLDHDSGWRTRC